VGLVVLAALFRGGRLAHVTEGQPIGQIGLGTAATQLFFVMFAYSGWNAASYLAGEVRNPGQNPPRSLLLGAGSVVLLYLAVNLVFAYAVPLADVGFHNAEQVPQLAVQNLFGSRASNVFSVLLGLTFLATVSAFIITGPRVYYAMARNGLFPSIAERISRKGQVPVYAMGLQSLCAIVILFALDFQNLYKYASVGLSLFAMLFIGAVYVLRWRRPDLERPFRVPGYPVVPAIFMVVTAFMAVFAFLQWPRPSLYSVGSILAGHPGLLPLVVPLSPPAAQQPARLVATHIFSTPEKKPGFFGGPAIRPSRGPSTWMITRRPKLEP
jgi:basic amino acid/polyamine antiporter, APA family